MMIPFGLTFCFYHICVFPLMFLLLRATISSRPLWLNTVGAT